MILRLDPPIPFFCVPLQEECQAHILLEYGLETFVYFIVVMDKTGEVWLFPNRDLRGTKNFTLDRPSINKEPFSQYFKKGSSDLHPLEETND